MLVKSDLKSKDAKLVVVWYLYRFDSVNEVVSGCSLCRDLSVKGLRMLVKFLES